MNAKTKAPPAHLPTLRQNSTTNSTLPDARDKRALKEAVDAVVNSFAKHTQGYGRGKFEWENFLNCQITYKSGKIHI